jgi:hypothetical protein
LQRQHLWPRKILVIPFEFSFQLTDSMCFRLPASQGMNILYIMLFFVDLTNTLIVIKLNLLVEYANVGKQETNMI